MKKFFTIIGILLYSTGFAQNPTKIEYLKEINQQIWQPFSEAYAANNAQKYIGLHSKDFIRTVGGKWKNISNWQSFQERTTSNFAKNNPNEKTEISFRFLERIADGQIASERGIYQVIRKTENGEIKAKFYGKFHVFMRKESNKWQILIDYDSDENNSINEESYKAAFAIDDFDKF